jgi:hypothetical protein
MIGTIRDVLTGGPLPLTEVACLIQQTGQAGHSRKGLPNPCRTITH